MPGRRNANLRSGDINENCALMMLQEIGLVAPVPRTEDVGADAYVTLLRPIQGRRLVPGDSFLVQVKSWSQNTIQWSNEVEISWLLNLELPFFLVRVDRVSTRIALYPTHCLTVAVLERIPYKLISIHFENSPDDRSDATHRHLNPGPPALEWYSQDICDEFRQEAYRILSSHVKTLRENISLRRIGQANMLRWKTNELPIGNGMMHMGNGSEDVKALESMIPAVRSWAVEIMFKKHYSDLSVLTALINTMRKRGIDPDPQDTLIQFAMLQADGDELTDAQIIAMRAAACPAYLHLGLSRLDDSAIELIPVETESLVLENTKVSDAGVAKLTRLTQLQRLNISHTQISDLAIDALCGMPKLDWVNLSGTAITSLGIDRLKKAKPTLSVVSSHQN